jgi:RNA polymerase sigma factor (sigma-70 family)
MVDDAQLLRQFVETRSEAAFAELVHRHLPLVYSTAARQLGEDRNLAEDIAQSVFVLLAEKSSMLLHHPSLAGWLHTATHFKVAHELRRMRRRQMRENAALAMSELERESTVEEWERIRPVLDQVLIELNERDREAVLLRFFENRSYAEIAARMRLTETAAHKCVERALEKLCVRLTRRGMTSTAALAVLLASHGAFAAPAGLAASVTGTVVASGLPVAAAIGGLTFMSTKTMAVISAAALVVGLGVTTHEVRRNRAAIEGLSAVDRDVSALRAQLSAEQERIARERTAQLAQAAARPVAPAPAAATTARPLSFTEEKVIEGRAFLKAHPEVEATLVAYYEITLRHQYADLISAMHLTEPEIEQFVAVLMKGRMRSLGEHIFQLTDEPPKPGEFARQLKEALGEERYQQYRDYDQTAPSRSLATELVRSLYYTPAALAPAQITQFKQLVQQVVDDRSLGPRYTSAWPWIPLPVWNEIAKRAGEVLSPEQRETLVDLQQQANFFHAQSKALTAYNAKK